MLDTLTLENCSLLDYYTASSFNFLPTFRDNLSISSSRVRGQELDPLKMGPIGCPETSVRNYHYSLCKKPEECSSLPQISFKYVSQLILQLMLECAFHLIT
jgi:hypothetical protein